MEFAPICIFAYKRADHLKSLLDSLCLNPESSLCIAYIFIDGPRTPGDINFVNEVVNLARKVDFFKDLKIIKSETNKGLANSIMSGVSYVLSVHESVIVLEDDLILSPFFLSYMNNGLSLYRSEDRVASIHGYVYPVKESLPNTFFIRGADCWGWATWKRAWSSFNANGEELLRELESKGLCERFDFDNSYPFTQMLKDQIIGKNNSWAIRWNASAFLSNKLTLYPGKSLVKNIGHDGSGENCDAVDIFNVDFSNIPVVIDKIKIEESQVAYLAFKNYFKTIKLNLLKRICRKIKKVLMLW